MNYRLVYVILLLCLCNLHNSATAQSSPEYEAYKALVDSFTTVYHKGTYYLVTGDSGTGIADLQGRFIIAPRYQMTQTSASGVGRRIDNWYEFKSRDETILTDMSLNILQRGDNETYAKLNDAYSLFLVGRQDGKQGVRTSDGRWIIPPVYERVHNYEGFRWPLAILKRDGGYGIFDTATQTEVSPFRYDYITWHNGYLAGHVADSLYVYDSTGKFRGGLPYHDIASYNSIIVASVHGMWAMLDQRTLKPLTPFIYKEFSSLGSVRYVGFKTVGGDFWGVMGRDGTILLPDIYDYLTPVAGNDLVAVADGDAALYDEHLQLLIPAQKDQDFRGIAVSYQGAALQDWVIVIPPVDKKARWKSYEEQDSSYLYNTRLKKGYPYKMDDRSYGDGVWFGGALLEVGASKTTDRERAMHRRHFIRRDGALLPFEFYEIEYLNENRLAIQLNGKQGIIDSNAKWIVDSVWGDIVRVTENVYAVAPRRVDTDTMKYKLVDNNGRVLTNMGFDNAPSYTAYGYVAASNEKWGVLSNDFSVRLPFVYDRAPQPVKYGCYYTDDTSLLMVIQNEKRGIINKDGTVVIPALYHDIHPWMNNFMLFDGRQYAIATRSGKLVTPFVHNNDVKVLNPFGDVVLKQGRKWGVLSHLGDTMQPFVYDTVWYGFCHDQYAVLVKDKEFTVINPSGTVLAPNLSCMPTRIDKSGKTIYCAAGDMFRKTVHGWKRFANNGQFSGSAQNLFNHPYELFAVRYHSEKDVRKGVYNRASRRIADPPRRNGTPVGHYFLYPDSTATRFSVIDTNGRVVLPFVKADSFWLASTVAIASDTLRHRYIIYHLDKKRKPDTADRFVSDNENNRKSVQYGALSNSYPAYTSLTWYNAKGTGMIHTYTGLDTFFRGLHTEGWFGQGPKARLLSDTLWGILTPDGRQWKIPPVLDTIFLWGHFGHLMFRQSGKAGLLQINTLETVIPPVWDSIYHGGGRQTTSHTFWTAKNNGKYSIVTQGGKVASDGWDSLSRWYQELYLRGWRNGVEYWVYPGADTRITYTRTEPEAPEGHYYGDRHVYQFEGNGKRGVYSKLKRAIIIPAIYDKIEHEGDFLVGHINQGEKPGLWVYNKSGALKFALPLVDLRYDRENDIWKVDDYKEASVLDTNGAIIVPGEYEDITRLNEKLYIVHKDGKWGLMAPGGKVIEPLIWEYLEASYPAVLASTDDKQCFMDVNGASVKTRCYEQLVEKGINTETELLEAYARKNGKWGMIDQKGKILMPFKYDSYNEIVEKSPGGGYYRK